MCHVTRRAAWMVGAVLPLFVGCSSSHPSSRPVITHQPAPSGRQSPAVAHHPAAPKTTCDRTGTAGGSAATPAPGITLIHVRPYPSALELNVWPDHVPLSPTVTDGKGF